MRLRQDGFTLVELLVLIAVICILAALLMSALQKALISARLASCANNQHQLFVGITLYGDDNKGHLPAPWPISYANLFRDVGYSDNPLLPMGLATLYRDNYLNDGLLVSCTDNDAGAYATATEPYGVARQMEHIYQSGSCLPLTSPNKTHRYTYALFPGIAAVTGGEYGVINQSSAWTWPNYTDYYNPSSVCSRISGNLPGGRNFRPSNGALARIRSPRPYLACYFPESSTNFKPHRLFAFNALYADGAIVRISLIDGTYESLKIRSLRTGFASTVITSYPNYHPPQ